MNLTIADADLPRIIAAHGHEPALFPDSKSQQAMVEALVMCHVCDKVTAFEAHVLAEKARIAATATPAPMATKLPAVDPMALAAAAAKAK